MVTVEIQCHVVPKQALGGIPGILGLLWKMNLLNFHVVFEKGAYCHFLFIHAREEGAQDHSTSTIIARMSVATW